MNAVGVKERILVIPDKPDVERESLAKAWSTHGGSVVRLGRFWDPPPLDPDTVAVYGSDSFCLVLQQKLGLNLVTPPDDLLVTCGQPLKRDVRVVTLAEALSSSFPAFVKSLTP